MRTNILCVCVWGRNQPAGPDRADQEVVKHRWDCGGHLKPSRGAGPEESLYGRHSNAGTVLSVVNSDLDLNANILFVVKACYIISVIINLLIIWWTIMCFSMTLFMRKPWLWGFWGGIKPQFLNIQWQMVDCIFTDKGTTKYSACIILMYSNCFNFACFIPLGGGP